jgi:hypothetical protein
MVRLSSRTPKKNPSARGRILPFNGVTSLSAHSTLGDSLVVSPLQAHRSLAVGPPPPPTPPRRAEAPAGALLSELVTNQPA